MTCCDIMTSRLITTVAVSLAVVALISSSLAQSQCNRLSKGGFLRESFRIDAYNSPCIIYQDLIIGAHATLTVDPGVTLQFNPGVMLAVNGTLIAKVTTTLCWANCRQMSVISRGCHL